jgi:similar to stage IV sporulation protein
MKNKYRKIHVSLKGVNLNRIYKHCSSENIEIFNVDRKDYKHIEFDIDYKDKNKLKNFIKSQNYEYEEAKTGFNKILDFFKYRFGILIGVIVFLIINIFSGIFIWDIKIYGNNIVSNEQILSVLKNNKIMVGGAVNNSILNNIETTLTNQIEDISLCSVVKKGTTIIVNVKEKLKNEEIESMYQGKDIIATENLTIIELSVSNGTPLKKIGDSVKKGDIIVAGYIFNSAGEKIICKANAQIKAKTWRTATEVYQKQVEVKTRTGNKSKTSFLSLFGMNFNVKSQKNQFENFEEETNVVLLKNSFLPFKMTVTTQYEVIIQTVEQDFEKDKQQLIENCQKNAYSFVKQSDVITQVFDEISEEKDCFIVTSYVEVIFQLS